MTNLWARECPGLIPAEVGAIVHWACVDLRHATELVDNIVSWRDAAMHRYEAPDPGAPAGVNTELHVDVVTDFYLEHPWLGETVSMSTGEEMATYMLRRCCGLSRGNSIVPLVSI